LCARCARELRLAIFNNGALLAQPPRILYNFFWARLI
jgi:hypothetical protein